jgi:hypothetical protein
MLLGSIHCQGNLAWLDNLRQGRVACRSKGSFGACSSMYIVASILRVTGNDNCAALQLL